MRWRLLVIEFLLEVRMRHDLDVGERGSQTLVRWQWRYLERICRW